MSSIPPSSANLVNSVLQASVSQRQRAVEKDTEEKKQTLLAREQAFLSDQQQNQVEDTLQTENARVRKHDDEESHQQRRHRHRQMPEDSSESTANEDEQTHIDLQA
jgi:hypothetical protein